MLEPSDAAAGGPHCLSCIVSTIYRGSVHAEFVCMPVKFLSCDAQIRLFLVHENRDISVDQILQVNGCTAKTSILTQACTNRHL